ncbi:unnamed protein product [Lactuca saligna]|uniref:SWIM-type domain-containing protein n=1 Tax=Lactuca saligna TaxID=75948 RepID=A0AA35Y811_LACSI|nr:unnamed protein product [Lactuca saligna]
MNLVVSEDNESGLEDDGVPRNEGNTTLDETHPKVGLEDEVINIDKIPLNKTSGDEFLSKLCPPEGDTGDNEVEEEDVEIHSIFNPDLQWKRQVPVIGMKFESPQQLKNMLCNYVVANGYQLCFKRNDSKRLVVELLRDDLELGMGIGFTLMYGQHKGLMEAIKDVLPCVEHRQCARHIVADFKMRLSPEAHNYLMENEPKTLSIAFYEVRRAYAAVEHGLSESFNAVIVKAKRKPMITTLEELGLYIMERMFILKHTKRTKDVSTITRQLLNGLKIKARYLQVLPSGLNKFETINDGQAYDMDLDSMICSCRLWKLNRYGCANSIATILFMNKDVDTYVDPMFCRLNYNKTYLNNILPMNGSNMWPHTSFTPPLPPQRIRMSGIPTTKRKRDVTEKMGKHKVSKKGKPIVCSAFHMPGHNKVTRLTTNKPVKLRVKRSKITKTTQESVGEASMNGGAVGVHGSMNSGAGSVHGGEGGVHGGEGSGVHGVRKKRYFEIFQVYP